MSLVTWKGALLLSPNGNLTLGPAADACCCVGCACHDLPDVLYGKIEHKIFGDPYGSPVEIRTDYFTLTVGPIDDSCECTPIDGETAPDNKYWHGIFSRRENCGWPPVVEEHPAHFILECGGDGTTPNTLNMRGRQSWYQCGTSSFSACEDGGIEEQECPIEIIHLTGVSGLADLINFWAKATAW